MIQSLNFIFLFLINQKFLKYYSYILLNIYLINIIFLNIFILKYFKNNYYIIYGRFIININIIKRILKLNKNKIKKNKSIIIII
jgi:hypothetical protein